MKVNLLSLCVILLAACAYQPGQYATDAQMPVQLVADQAVGGEISDDEHWWQAFALPQLESLMQELDVNSLDMQTASARLDRALAQLGAAKTQNWPSVDARVNHKVERDLDNGATENSDSAGLSASYEWDLWGIRQAEQVAARLQLDAADMSQKGLRLRLQSELAVAVFRQLALRQQLHISAQNETASKQLLSLLEIRFAEGDVSGIEVRQQQNTLLSSQLSLLKTQQDAKLNQRVIATLLGRNSMAVSIQPVSLTALQLPALLPQQPASRLLARPDLQLADIQLQIADTELYQAEKAVYPRLSLSADLSLADLADLGAGLRAGIAHLLTLPVFNAGLNQRQIEISQLDAHISLLNYRKVAQLAVQEALDSLDNYFFQQSNLQLVEQELNNNLALYELAQVRFDAGETDFINLLGAQRSWFSAQIKYNNQQRDSYIAAVEVYRALAGAPALQRRQYQIGDGA